MSYRFFEWPFGSFWDIVSAVWITFNIIFTVFLLSAACGPQFDREAMDDVKRTYCTDVLRAAMDLEEDGLVLSPEELEAVRFCRER